MHTEVDMEDFTINRWVKKITDEWEKKYRIEIGYIILTETSVFEKKHFL